MHARNKDTCRLRLSCMFFREPEPRFNDCKYISEVMYYSPRHFSKACESLCGALSLCRRHQVKSFALSTIDSKTAVIRRGGVRGDTVLGRSFAINSSFLLDH